MKKLLLILLAFLAFTPPQANAERRMRTDRLFFKTTGASQNTGLFQATYTDGNGYKTTTIGGNTQLEYDINKLEFRPTTTFKSLEGVEITQEEYNNLVDNNIFPIIIECNNTRTYGYNKAAEEYGFRASNGFGLVLPEWCMITFKTSDPKYKIHSVFFDATSVTTNTTSEYYKARGNINTKLFPCTGLIGNPTNITTGWYGSGASSHPDPAKNGAALTAFQKRYDAPTEDGVESIQFWNDRTKSTCTGSSTNWGVYFSEIIVVWSEDIPTPSAPAAPIISLDQWHNTTLSNGYTLNYLSSSVPPIFVFPGEEGDNSTELRYTWRDDVDEVTIDNYETTTSKYDTNLNSGAGLTIENDKDRLRVYAVRDGFISGPVTLYLKKHDVAAFASLEALMKPENDGKLVTLNKKLRTRGWFTGANPKVGNAFFDMYAYDGDKAIKVHYFAAGYTPTNPNADNPIRIVAKNEANEPYASWARDQELIRTGSTTLMSPHRYYTVDNTIVGIYRHNGGAAPSIEISNNTSGSFNYSTLAWSVIYKVSHHGDDSGTTDTPSDKTVPLVKRVQTVGYLTEADFNHQRALASALYRNYMFELTTPTGETQRVKIDDTYTVAAPSQLEENERYYVEGIVGASGVNYSIVPLQVSKCPVAPVLLAPNRIDTDAVNMISSSFRITMPSEGVDPATTYSYVFEGLVSGSITTGTLTLDEATDREKGIPVDAARFDGNSCTLTVVSELGGVKSEPVTITITSHNATGFSTIADFKKEYLSKEADLPEVDSELGGANTHYCRLDGSAVIVKKTPEYLYLRDLEATDPDGAFKSENYLLVHNANGWLNSLVDDNGTERELAEGDVITGFALVPAVSRLKNLVSETTGFARTVRYTGQSVDNGELEPEVIIVDNTNPDSPDYYTAASKGFDDSADRMRYYTLKSVQVLRRLNTGAKDADSKWKYLLKLGSDKEAEWPELTLNVFTVRDGWAAAFGDDDSADGQVFPFEITGVAMRNGEAGKFALAMTEFKGTEAPAAPAVTLRGADDNGGASAVQYVYTGTIDLTPAESGDQIWYTTDGSDALQNPARKLFTGDYTGTNSDLALVGAREQVVVSAFSIRPGSSPSATTMRVFERLATEREFIANILKGNDGQWYHFNGDVRVEAVGPEYMFVRGVLGQYLPVFSADGWTGIKPGDYLTDFVVRHTLSNGNIQVNTTEESEFTPSDKPSGSAEIKLGEPDEVNSISESNLRRLVTLRHAVVTRNGSSWSIKGQDDQAQTRGIAIGKAGEMTGDELADNGVYDITGFVMYGTDGNLEIWPVSAAAVTASGNVTAGFSTGTEVTPSGDELNVRFYPMTLVTLEAENEDATIYYAVYDENVTPESAVVWSPYVRPIYIVENGRLHAYAAEPGKEPGAHLHINFSRAEMSGDVHFEVSHSDGKTMVELSPAGTVPAGTEIHYSIGSFAEDDFITYTGAAFEVTKTAIVYARIKEPGKIAGAVSHVLVEVVEPVVPADKISGKVRFDVKEAEDGSAMIVTIEPDTEVSGEYTIYYLINPTENVTPENGTVYTTPISMKEGGRIIAILVESGKIAGEPADVNVWLIPTGIDGIGADSIDSVRVEGNSIIAPEGSAVFDITGRRVNATGLRAGIYIVRTADGKSVKVKIG